eukprot:TRINITY_DN10877_c0_g1_i3.p1 TRINITY_DN10877_c0_g1~~TRINITY_DN10877_c0_g1_i3.p1  ORF type:complete len:159 (+),score=37.94 TRINITY_DN10877_c0_g1_i3:1025-1501(+)
MLQIVQQKGSADIGQSDTHELPDTTQTITTTQPDKEEKELHDNEPSIPKDKDESLELSQTDQTKEGVDMGQPIPISPTEPEKDKELIIPTSISQLDQEQIPLGQTDIQPEEHYPSNSPLEETLKIIQRYNNLKTRKLYQINWFFQFPTIKIQMTSRSS